MPVPLRKGAPGNAWLKLSGGVRSLPQVPRWNAERRAAQKRIPMATSELRGAEA